MSSQSKEQLDWISMSARPAQMKSLAKISPAIT